MDNRSLKALEYDKILNQLAEYCVNESTKQTALSLSPKTDQMEIEQALNQTDEAVKMLLRSGNAPISLNENIEAYLGRAAVGSVLQIYELRRIAALLRTIGDLISYYHEDGGEGIALLDDYFEMLDACQDLESQISRKLISDTEISDNASRELARIRREMTLVSKRITDKLQGIVNAAENERYLQDRIITVRNQRYVVPVKAEYRSRFPGIVLDRSSSGQTLYIEPAVIVELNNDLRLLEAEERDEIERILKELTERVALYRNVLHYDYESLIELDFIFAKAQYALDLGANKLEFSDDHQVALFQVRHPLIDRDKVVASDIVLDPDIHTMLITGPNTGGKTVTLKTFGLITLMAQSGLFVPVKEASKSRLFEHVFADIGDEQSIEQSLSTFSSHMTNIVEILRLAESDALILFDELGAGTDPEEGAALAMSILDHLRQRDVLSLATTHYAELKEYGLTTPGVVNASVEFDVRTLSPTYRLRIGIPGKSNAFEIASHLGLPEEIIQISREKISSQTREFQKTLAAAEEKTRQAEEALEQARRREEEASEALKKAEALREKNEAKAEKLLMNAQLKAQEFIRETKEQTDLIYREIQTIQREAEASVDNKTLERLRREITKADKKAREAEEANRKSRSKMSASGKKIRFEDLKLNDRVYLKTLDREAQIIELIPKNKRIMVQSGPIKLAVKLEDFVLIGEEKKEPQKKKVTVNRTTANVSTKLDLRGRTVEEALFMTEQFLSDALFAGKKKVTIVHGMGTGKVRSAVQDYLKKSSMIKNYRYGKPDEGGTGATIVSL